MLDNTGIKHMEAKQTKVQKQERRQKSQSKQKGKSSGRAGKEEVGAPHASSEAFHEEDRGCPQTASIKEEKEAGEWTWNVEAETQI